MKSLIDRTSRSNKNIMTLLMGATFAQAIPIAITPILTRIYTPEDFGVFAMFTGISLVLGAIANGRYEMAVLLPDSDSDALNVAALSVIVAISVSLASLGVIVFFHSKLVDYIGNPEVSFWLFLVPISVAIIGCHNTLNYLNTRYQNYSDISKATVVKSLAMAVSQVVVGSLKSGPTGLVVGSVLASTLATLRLLRSARISVLSISSISVEQMRVQARKYSRFPKFSMPGILAGAVSRELLSVGIPVVYSLGALGGFAMARKVLGLPSAAIGNSISQVYFQEACSERIKTGEVKESFLLTFRKLLLIAILLFIPLFFLIEDLFAIAFGADWREAGTVTKYMLPYFFVRFVCAPLTVTLSAIERQDVSFFINIALLFSAAGTLVVAHFGGIDFLDFILLFSATMAFVNGIVLVVIWLLCRGS